ncbi:unnamed protein product [Diatraea saccharalis]|uniref:Uncharacterized protein n=1 Tax=Diatraea saccharalis TaxID=40085 RepID=A0A9N9QUS8_9NEOP|nr:unnamed protein product [Diatraea saccharalis]
MNDKNPYLLFSELSIALYKLRHSKVFIINVQFNPYLKKDLLNYNIKLLTKNYPNCNFLEINTKNFLTNRNHYLNQLCMKINCEIDYITYYNEYLAPQQIKKRLLKSMKLNNHLNKSKKNKITLIQKTIPFYFRKKVIDKLTVSPNDNFFRMQKSSCPISSEHSEHSKQM